MFILSWKTPKTSNFSHLYRYKTSFWSITMKKVIFTALLLALSLSISQEAFTATKDSTSLTVTNLRTDITKAENQTPIGTVIAWPFSKMPSDGNWLECNGQTVSAATYPEFVANFGSTTPDYRGLFLRGQGGGSNALGEFQDYALPATVGRGQFIGGLSGNGGDEYKNTEYQPGQAFRVKNYWCCYGGGGNQWPGITYEMDLFGGVPDANKGNEIRPANRAVKYIIKVR